MDRERLRAEVKALLAEGLRLDLAPADIPDDTPIFGDGLGLDSIDALELVVLVEERFRVAIPDEEVGKRAFASVAALVEVIAAERGGQGSQRPASDADGEHAGGRDHGPGRGDGARRRRARAGDGARRGPLRHRSAHALCARRPLPHRRRGARGGAGAARGRCPGHRAAALARRPLRARRRGRGVSGRGPRRGASAADGDRRRRDDGRHARDRGGISAPPRRRGPPLPARAHARHAAVDERGGGEPGARSLRPAGDLLDRMLVERARDRGRHRRHPRRPHTAGARDRHRPALPAHLRRVRRPPGARPRAVPALRRAAALVLEEADHARARGARIHALVLGYGTATDAYHPTAPHPAGAGAVAALRAALADAGVSPERVDYVNAHGSGTPQNDAVEVGVLRAVFGRRLPRVPVSSTKSQLGHTLGAAGAVEAVVTVRALSDGLLPPTVNLRAPDPAWADLDLVPEPGRRVPLGVAVTSSYGFGGHNVTLVLGRVGAV